MAQTDSAQSDGHLPFGGDGQDYPTPRVVTPEQRIGELEREVRIYRDGLVDIIQIAKRAGALTVPSKVRDRARDALDAGPRS